MTVTPGEHGPRTTHLAEERGGRLVRFRLEGLGTRHGVFPPGQWAETNRVRRRYNGGNTAERETGRCVWASINPASLLPFLPSSPPQKKKKNTEMGTQLQQKLRDDHDKSVQY